MPSISSADFKRLAMLCLLCLASARHDGGVGRVRIVYNYRDRLLSDVKLINLHELPSLDATSPATFSLRPFDFSQLQPLTTWDPDGAHFKQDVTSIQALALAILQPLAYWIRVPGYAALVNHLPMPPLFRSDFELVCDKKRVIQFATDNLLLTLTPMLASVNEEMLHLLRTANSLKHDADPLSSGNFAVFSCPTGRRSMGKLLRLNFAILYKLVNAMRDQLADEPLLLDHTHFHYPPPQMLLPDAFLLRYEEFRLCDAGFVRDPFPRLDIKDRDLLVVAISTSTDWQELEKNGMSMAKAYDLEMVYQVGAYLAIQFFWSYERLRQLASAQTAERKPAMDGEGGQADRSIHLDPDLVVQMLLRTVSAQGDEPEKKV